MIIDINWLVYSIVVVPLQYEKVIIAYCIVLNTGRLGIDTPKDFNSYDRILRRTSIAKVTVRQKNCTVLFLQ